MRGSFITLEGPEGAGKSSARQSIISMFPSQDIIIVREPGSTPLGEKIREMVHNDDMPDRSELLLFEAARACIVDAVIVPALKDGKCVVCDRFYDSTTAYQGFGRGIALDDIRQLNSLATEGLDPDLTIMFDIDPKIGMTRKGKATDRIESAGEEFHDRVRNGFLEIAKANPERCTVIDASAPQSVVADTISELLVSKFGWVKTGEKV